MTSRYDLYLRRLDSGSMTSALVDDKTGGTDQDHKGSDSNQDASGRLAGSFCRGFSNDGSLCGGHGRCCGRSRLRSLSRRGCSKGRGHGCGFFSFDPDCGHRSSCPGGTRLSSQDRLSGSLIRCSCDFRSLCRFGRPVDISAVLCIRHHGQRIGTDISGSGTILNLMPCPVGFLIHCLSENDNNIFLGQRIEQDALFIRRGMDGGVLNDTCMPGDRCSSGFSGRLCGESSSGFSCRCRGRFSGRCCGGLSRRSSSGLGRGCCGGFGCRSGSGCRGGFGRRSGSGFSGRSGSGFDSRLHRRLCQCCSSRFLDGNFGRLSSRFLSGSFSGFSSRFLGGNFGRLSSRFLSGNFGRLSSRFLSGSFSGLSSRFLGGNFSGLSSRFLSGNFSGLSGLFTGDRVRKRSGSHNRHRGRKGELICITVFLRKSRNQIRTDKTFTYIRAGVLPHDMVPCGAVLDFETNQPYMGFRISDLCDLFTGRSFANNYFLGGCAAPDRVIEIFRIIGGFLSRSFNGLFSRFLNRSFSGFLSRGFRGLSGGFLSRSFGRLSGGFLSRSFRGLSGGFLSGSFDGLSGGFLSGSFRGLFSRFLNRLGSDWCIRHNRNWRRERRLIEITVFLRKRSN